VPEVLSAVIQEDTAGMERLQGSVEVIVIESVLEIKGTFKLVLSTVNDETGGLGGSGGSELVLLQAIKYKEIQVPIKKTRYFEVLINGF
jgi:hypothetical protein